MTSPASLEGHERLRLFVALPLSADAVERLVAWQAAELADVDEARVVPPGNLHVTLAFLGRGRPPNSQASCTLCATRRDAVRPVLTPRGYRETRSVGMVVLEDEHGRATRLAGALGRPSSGSASTSARPPVAPHVTVLRPPRHAPARRFRSWGGSFRPKRLSIIRCCGRPGRSTRFSNRFLWEVDALTDSANTPSMPR